MATKFKTRFSLNSEKQEQITGDTFVFSGNTSFKNPISYLTDVSSQFTARSIVDRGYMISGSSTPFQYDSRATIKNNFAYRSNVDIKGQGQIIVTNGSSIVSGISTNFTDGTTGSGMNYWFQFWFKDSTNNWYFTYVGSIQSNTKLTASSFLSRTIIRVDGFNLNNVVPTTFTGVTGTYDYYIGALNWSDGLYSVALGNNSYADNFGVAIGGSNVSIGGGFAAGYGSNANSVGVTAIGYRAYASGGFGATAFGVATKATGRGSFAAGTGADFAGTSTDRYVIAGGAAFNFSENDGNQGLGHGALARGSAILGGFNHNIPSNSDRSAILGGNAIKALSATTDTVYVPKLRIGQGTGGALTSGSTSNDYFVRATGGELQIRRFNAIVTGATNGLTRNGATIRLGGTLTGSTQIGLGANSITFTATTGSLRYGGNYRANFVDKTLVDVGYVTGITNTLLTKTAFNTYSGLTASRLGTVESLYITGATNGLTKTGKKLKLGGTLTGNTAINTGTNNLAFTGTTSTYSFGNTGSVTTSMSYTSGGLRLQTQSISLSGDGFVAQALRGATQISTGAGNTALTFIYGSQNQTSGTNHVYRFQSGSMGGSSGNATINTVTIEPNIAPTGTQSGGTFTILNVSPTYNFTGRTNTARGLDYNPVLTGIVGLTHYGLTVRPAAALSGFGTGTPTATLQANGNSGTVTLKTVGAGTTTNFSIRSFQSDGVTEIFSLQDSGVIRFNNSAGTSGQLLQSNGTSTAPSWTTALANGTTAITQSPNDSSTNVATTAYVNSAVNSTYSLFTYYNFI